MGYTINRVSLFALIFSIGILVDDAIVVVENIARHWAMNDGRDRMTAAIEAVAEVGNPTVVATLTVVAALLPMLFVSGMMGPYMAPIPANASAAMLFSFFVAMVIAPWAMLKISGKPRRRHQRGAIMAKGRLGALYRRMAAPDRAPRAATPSAFLLYVAGATVLVCLLFVTENVTVKLLPFDNKSELEVMVDLPEGATVEDTGAGAVRAPRAMTEAIAGSHLHPGLCRHARAVQFQRPGAALLSAHSSRNWASWQVNLTDKSERGRESHAIALDLRKQARCADAFPKARSSRWWKCRRARRCSPRCWRKSTAPTRKTRRAVAEETKKLFKSVPYIVDVDDSWGEPRPRLRISIDQDKLEYFGVEQSDVYDTLSALLGGVPVGYSHRGADRDPDRDRGARAQERSDLVAEAGLDAGSRQRPARQQGGGRAWRCGQRDARNRARR